MLPISSWEVGVNFCSTFNAYASAYPVEQQLNSYSSVRVPQLFFNPTMAKRRCMSPLSHRLKVHQQFSISAFLRAKKRYFLWIDSWLQSIVVILLIFFPPF
jgi:hypothetical protein